MFAEDEARLLHAAATGAELDALVQRRVAGEPLEQLLGWARFDGLRVRVAPGVFVPRRRTEHLVRLASELVESVGGSVLAADLCCGSGAVAMSLLARNPSIEMYACDVDPAATACARLNLGDRAVVVTGDLFDALPAALRGRVDVLTANTPYVPTGAIAAMPPEARDHEPMLALDGGADGLDLQRRVAAGAGDWLAPGGQVLVEVSTGQATASALLFAAAGLTPRVDADDELGATVVLARAAS